MESVSFYDMFQVRLLEEKIIKYTMTTKTMYHTILCISSAMAVIVTEHLQSYHVTRDLYGTLMLLYHIRLLLHSSHK